MTGHPCLLPLRAVAGTAALLSVIVLALPAGAEPAPPFATLLNASADTPRAQAIAADVAVAEGLAAQARARPNPVASVLTENVAGSAPYAGFAGAETTLQIAQPFELGGKRAARIAAGLANRTLAQTRAETARLAYAHDLALAYAGVEIAERRIERAADEVAQAEADTRIARALVDAGKEPRLRGLQAETALGGLRADLELTKANRLAALARLSALAGREIPFTGISESLIEQVPPGLPVGPAAPTHYSAYRTALAESEAAARRVRVEETRIAPDITATLGVRRLEREGATALLVGASVPLPLWDRNRGAIAAARAEAHGAAARAEMARLDAAAGAAGAAAQVEAGQRRVETARRFLATAEEGYRLGRIAYEAGKAPLSELISARRNLGAARTQVLDALADRFTAFANLARIEGRTVTGDQTQ